MFLVFARRHPNTSELAIARLVTMPDELADTKCVLHTVLKVHGSVSIRVEKRRGSGGTPEATRCVRPKPFLGTLGGALVLGRVRGLPAYAQDTAPAKAGGCSFA